MGLSSISPRSLNLNDEEKAVTIIEPVRNLEIDRAMLSSLDQK